MLGGGVGREKHAPLPGSDVRLLAPLCTFVALVVLHLAVGSVRTFRSAPLSPSKCCTAPLEDTKMDMIMHERKLSTGVREEAGSSEVGGKRDPMKGTS